MRPILVMLFVLLAGPAEANTVVVMTDRAEELGAALEVALANRRVDIAHHPSPAGDLRLDRAAAAQRAAVAASADAAVWIDLGDSIDVCAVSADGRYFRHAPISEISPRMFAAIATSLLDELLAPPEGPLDVSVNVNVSVGPAFTAPPSMPPPSPVVVDVLAPPRSAKPVRHDRTLFEIGPMITPVSYGAEATLLFPLSTRWRFGAMGTVTLVFDENLPLYGGAAELRYVGNGQRRHFDLGLLAGAASAEGDSVLFAGVRLNWMWEGETRGTSVSLAPILIFVPPEEAGADSPVVPGVWASLRWGLPL